MKKAIDVKVKIEVTEKPTLKQKRTDLRNELDKNALKSDAEVLQHRPWTYIKIHSWYHDPKDTAKTIDVDMWGVSKICWPDKWDEAEGVDKAYHRALAWAVKIVIPPHNGIAPKRKEELVKLQKEYA